MEQQDKQDSSLRDLDYIAQLMDSRFRIPGTNIRFGLDPILSLFPAAGNIVSYIISGLLVLQMVRHGASGKLAIKMIFNICLDFLISSIPILGTIFTVGYKANNRNVRLLKDYYGQGFHRGSGLGLLLTVIGVLILLVVVFIFLALMLTVWIVRWLGSLG